MSNRFKSALFSGFNRRDVVSYITDQAKQKEALSDQTAGLEAQLEDVRQALADAQKENETLRAELAEARQRAAAAEETCRGMQQAVRSSLAELNALSGTFDGRTKEDTRGEDAELPEPEEETELFEEPCFPEDDTPADPVPAEDAAPEAEEDVCEQPGDDTPAEDVPEEPAASAAEGAPVKRRTVEIRRHERI
jgi:regulator of replication initiation timing